MADTFIFPEDLGTDQTGHCVGFTAYESSAMTRTASYITSPIGAIGNRLGLSNYLGEPQGDVARRLSTPQDNIFMYIPGGGQSVLNWDQEHQYTDIKMSRIVPNALGAISGMGETLTQAAETVGTMLGHPINPRIEVLYQTTKLREFDFKFMMAPQSQNESEQMEGLIKSFRKRSAPTLNQASFNNLFNAPSEWMIHFWHRPSGGGWVENPHIPKISRCVLNRVAVTYPIPGGEYSTFGNGYPVSAMLEIHFNEMAIIDSDKIDKGY